MSDENKKEESGIQADNDGIAIGSLSIGGSVDGTIIIGDHNTVNTLIITEEQVIEISARLSTQYQPQPFDGNCPYRGLDVFEEEDAELFFGRERLVDDLVSRVKDSRTLFVTGPSGSGKSSLVRAGLIHALKQGAIKNSERWLYATMKPGSDPISELGQIASSLAGTTKAEDEVCDKAMSDSTIFARWCEIALKEGRDKRLVLFIDQFEEVFTQINNETVVVAFLNLLTHAATVENGRVMILFSMRSDFVPNCAMYPQLNSLLNQQFVQIGAMEPNELVSAIALPSKHVSLPIEDSLIARIINQMEGQPGALPLMQFALKDLFDSQKAKGGRITLKLDDYLQRGGIHKALERHADDSFSKLNENEQELARFIFGSLVETGHDTPDTRRTVLFDDLIPNSEKTLNVKAVIQKLENARLITTDERDNNKYTITHEKLIEAWPWLNKLVDENRDVFALKNEIMADSKEWEEHHRDLSYLYTGVRLISVLEKIETKNLVLSGRSLEFVKTGQAQQRRGQFVRIASISAIIGAVVVGIILYSYVTATNSQNLAKQKLLSANTQVALAGTSQAMAVTAQANAEEAQRQATNRIAEGLAAYATGHAQMEYDLSLLLGLEANNSLNNNITSTSLMTIVKSNPYLYQYLHINDGWVNTVAFDSEGKVLAAGSASGTVTLWSPAVPSFQQYTPLNRIDVADIAVTKIAFKPSLNGDTTLAVGYSDGEIILWDYAKSQPLLTLMTHAPFRVSTLALSRDGIYMASADESGHVCLWDMQIVTPTCQVIGDVGGKIWQIVFSQKADGSLFLAGVGGGDNSIFVWEIPTGNLIVQKSDANGDAAIYSFAVDSSGSLFATGDGESNIKIWQWDGKNLSEAQTFSGEDGHSYWVISLKFIPVPDDSSGEGDWLASGSGDHDLILWQRDGDNFAFSRKLNAHSGFVLDLEYDINNQLIASTGSDGKVILWMPWAPYEIRSSWNANYPIVVASGINPIYAYSDDQLVSVYHSGDDTLVCEFSTYEEPITALALQPKNGSAHLLAVGFSDGQIELYALDEEGCPRISLLETGGRVNNLAFDYTGTYLASARESQSTGNIANNALIWNVADAQNPRIEQQLDTAGMPVRAVTFSPTQPLLAYTAGQGSQSMITLWDVQKRESQSTLGSGNDFTHAHTNNIWSLAFSPNGSLLASASGDTYVKLWDVENGKFIFDFTGHKNGVTEVDFSATGDELASIDRSGKLILWDVVKKQLLVQLDTGYDIQDPFFHPHASYLNDANWILSSDGASAVTFWDINLSHLRLRGCEVVNRNLSDTEREYYQLNDNGETCPGAEAGTLLTKGYLNKIQGDQPSADQAFLQATNEAISSQNTWVENTVCWFGSLNGFAKIVLPACEDMVENTPEGGQDNAYLSDSLAVARALTGDYAGAIEAEQVFVNYYQNDGEKYQSIVALRKEWIDKLGKGVNPFDDATLQYLRLEVIP